MTFDVETIGAMGAAVTAFVGVVVAAWTRIAPVVREVVSLARMAADAVGAHPDMTSVTTQVSEMRVEMRAGFAAAERRMGVLESRMSSLDCQACSVDADDLPTPPTTSMPMGSA